MGDPKIQQGCILIARKILTSDIWSKPPHYLKVWIYILSKAQHSDYKKLRRGQLITSIPEIIEDCSWYVGYRKEKLTKDQVFQVLEWLRKPHDTPPESNAKATIITTTKATQKLLITVDNYDLYQTLINYESNAEPDNEKVTKATREQRQPDNINKNDNNVKNDNKYIIIYEAYLAADITQHKTLTEVMKKSIDKVLKKYKIDDVLLAIKRYAEMYHDKAYEWCQYKWSLNELLTRDKGIGYFLDDGDKWINYCEFKNKNKKISSSNNSFDFSYFDK